MEPVNDIYPVKVYTQKEIDEFFGKNIRVLGSCKDLFVRKNVTKTIRNDENCDAFEAVQKTLAFVLFVIFDYGV